MPGSHAHVTHPLRDMGGFLGRPNGPENPCHAKPVGLSCSRRAHVMLPVRPCHAPSRFVNRFLEMRRKTHTVLQKRKGSERAPMSCTQPDGLSCSQWIDMTHV